MQMHGFGDCTRKTTVWRVETQELLERCWYESLVVAELGLKLLVTGQVAAELKAVEREIEKLLGVLDEELLLLQ